MKSVLTKRQRLKFGPKVYTEDGTQYRIIANVRYDDECGNGHNSFSVTGDIQRQAGNNRWARAVGGCIHEEIEKHFPELRKYIKWHLCSSDGPMHYLANTMYHAGDRDCYGKKKGEPKSWDKVIYFDGFPLGVKFSVKFIEFVERQRNKAYLPGFIVQEVPHKDKEGHVYASKYTFKGFNCEWYQCPFDSKREAEEFQQAFKLPFSVTTTPTSWGEGKAPDIEGARHCAIWPDATLEQLNDKQALIDRLPALMEEFKKDVEKLGLVF